MHTQVQIAPFSEQMLRLKLVLVSGPCILLSLLLYFPFLSNVLFVHSFLTAFFVRYVMMLSCDSEMTCRKREKLIRYASKLRVKNIW